MLRAALCFLALSSAGVAAAHHSKCAFDENAAFMSCGAHSGRISFKLQNYGEVNLSTQQMVLCGDKPVDIEKLEFTWVESDNKDEHFPMKDLKIKQISPECALLGGLDFTPPAAYESAEQNAWKLEIYVSGVDVPSSVFVEAKAKP